MLAHKNEILLELLQGMDLGSSVAEADNLLETARVETSAFSDLYADRVDLVPGTKGSGKSALFRIFVEFLPIPLLGKHKVIVAHGVQAPGDPVFNAYETQFASLSEEDFVSFWCVYLVSLAHEQFIKDPKYRTALIGASVEVDSFRRACAKAGVPEIRSKLSLRDILGWSLRVLQKWRPKLKFELPQDSGALELDLFGNPVEPSQSASAADGSMPTYLNEITETLEGVLGRTDLSLWLMVDRLDEIFPRRSAVERTALRALLRAMKNFSSKKIRVKVFLRDDMLDHIVASDEGFTALTHVTVRQSDTLRWTRDQLLAMVVKRIFANEAMAKYLNVNRQQLDANSAYRAECFDKVFPQTVYKGPKQSRTMDWIFGHCADGRGVVTPRDVMDLLLRARQRQQDFCSADTDGESEAVIGGAAIQYGLEELSKRKRITYLQAEFPHLWPEMQKFVGGKSEFSENALRTLLGEKWKKSGDDLAAVGFFSVKKSHSGLTYSIPFLYRHGMDITQGKA
jgi:hypothetical protein